MLTVIVPVYNVAPYLNECIDSICKQSYRNLQIVLVDDGSTDGSSDICDAWQRRDNRIEVIHKENGGLPSARKAGLSLARGNYVAFVDGDDWLELNCFELLCGLIPKCAADIIAFSCVEEYSSYSKIVDNNIPDGFYSKQWLAENKNLWFVGEVFFSWGILPHLCDKIIKTELIKEKYGQIPNNISFGEDAASSFPCINKAESLLVVNKPLYHYRQRSGSMVKYDGELANSNFTGLYRVLANMVSDDIHMQVKLREYLFFTLLLKKYSCFERYMPLFPFRKVHVPSRVFIYGAGGFGKVIYRAVVNNPSLSLAGWTDKNYQSEEMKSLPLSEYDSIYSADYDVIVIAILNEEVAMSIKKELIAKGIPAEKIDIVSTNVIDAIELPEWLTDS